MDFKKLGAAAVIFNDKNEVLLVKQSYGRFNWELPGGGAEIGESITETAIREVREETGLVVVAKRICGIYFDVEADFHHFVFECRALDANAEFQFDAEVTECAYWPLTALPRPISDFTIQRIEDAARPTDLVLPVTVSGRKWLESTD